MLVLKNSQDGLSSVSFSAFRSMRAMQAQFPLPYSREDGNDGQKAKIPGRLLFIDGHARRCAGFRQTARYPDVTEPDSFSVGRAGSPVGHSWSRKGKAACPAPQRKNRRRSAACDRLDIDLQKARLLRYFADKE